MFTLGNVGCDSLPCLNGGTCNEDGNGYTCTCDQGYSGDNCDTGRFNYVFLLSHDCTYFCFCKLFSWKSNIFVIHMHACQILSIQNL